MDAAENTASPHARAAPTTLVIESDPGMLDVLCQFLSGAGYILLQAASGSAGLALLEQQGVDLVVLDLQLPDIEGWEVNTITCNSITVSPPILVLTGTSRVNGAATSLELGADAFLRKPFEPEELLA